MNFTCSPNDDSIREGSCKLNEMSKKILRKILFEESNE
jgi:hypothetical protein